MGDASRGLEEALVAEVLEHDGGRLRFAHPLLAAAVQERTPAPAWRALHHRLAGIVTDIEQRARHLAEAARRTRRRHAAALEAAAERAAERGAPAVAADLAERAERGADAPRRRRGPAALLVAGGRAGRGRRRRGPSGIARPRRLSRTLCRPRPGASAHAARLHRHRGRRRGCVHAAAPEPGARRGRRRRCAARADQPPDQRALALNRRPGGDAVHRAGRDPRRAVWRRRPPGALSRGARSSGMRWARACSAACSSRAPGSSAARASPPPAPVPTRRSCSSWRSAPTSRRQEHCWQAKASTGVRRTGNDDLAGMLHMAGTELELRSGRLAAADDHAQRMFAITAGSGISNYESAGRWARGLVDAHLGRVESAVEQLHLALDLARRADDRVFALNAARALGLLEALRVAMRPPLPRGWRRCRPKRLRSTSPSRCPSRSGPTSPRRSC